MFEYSKEQYFVQGFKDRSFTMLFGFTKDDGHELIIGIPGIDPCFYLTVIHDDE